MIYPLGSVAAVLVALIVDRWITVERLVGRAAFWIAYAIVIVFQLVMNGLLTGIPILTYDAAVIWGPRLVYAPIEDIGFGFGLVLITLTTWSRLGRAQTESPNAPN